MTAQERVVILCDGVRSKAICHQQYGFRFAYDSEEEARQDAIEDNGWLNCNGNDYCPKCK